MDTAIGIFGNLISLTVSVFAIFILWKVFVKANQPGWASIIPIYNWIVIFQIAGKPAWWVLLMLIPLVNLVILIITYLEIGKRFGKSGVWSFFLLVLFSLIGLIIIAFDDSVYTPETSTAPAPAIPATEPTMVAQTPASPQPIVTEPIAEATPAVPQPPAAPSTEAITPNPENPPSDNPPVVPTA